MVRAMENSCGRNVGSIPPGPPTLTTLSVTPQPQPNRLQRRPQRLCNRRLGAPNRLPTRRPPEFTGATRTALAHERRGDAGMCSPSGEGCACACA